MAADVEVVADEMLAECDSGRVTGHPRFESKMLSTCSSLTIEGSDNFCPLRESHWRAAK